MGDTQFTLKSLIDIITPIIAVVSIVIALRKAPYDIRKIDSEISLNYASATSKYADELLRIKSEIDDLRQIISPQQSTVNDQDKEIKALKELSTGQDVKINALSVENVNLKSEMDEMIRVNGLLRDWNEKLIKQIKSFGEKPIISSFDEVFYD